MIFKNQTTKADRAASAVDGEAAVDNLNPHVSPSSAEVPGPAGIRKPKKILQDKWPVLILVPIILFLISFAIGKYPISPLQLIHTLFYHIADASQIQDGNMETVLFNIRLPRVLTALLVGGGLSVAGASYQGMFRNPMVSPDILGASAGAGLGAALAMLLCLNTVMIQAFAFCGGVIAVFIATKVSGRLSRDQVIGLVLAGIMTGTLLQAGTSIVKILADAEDKLPDITFWLMGSFASINKRDFWCVLIPVAIGFIILMGVRWQLNVMSFGEDEARSLGIKTKRVRNLIIIASTLITASCVASSGMIGWVGLVIPHLGRAMVGPNYRQLMPTCFILGASYLLLVDNVARLLFSVEIPIGILTAIMGVPFFFFIFRNNSKGWN